MAATARLNRLEQAHALVRLVASGTMVVHGCYRLFTGGVSGFAGALTSLAGMPEPVAFAVAWTLTLAEILGGASIAIGRFVRPLCLWFVAELVTGIVLVHAPSGWFVVGGGRNGMEYSAVLICLFLAVAWVGGRGDTRSS